MHHPGFIVYELWSAVLDFLRVVFLMLCDDVPNTTCCSSYDGWLTDIDSSTLYWILECEDVFTSLLAWRKAWLNFLRDTNLARSSYLISDIDSSTLYWILECMLCYGIFHLNTSPTKDVTGRLAWNKSFSFFLFNFYNLHRISIFLARYLL